MVAAELKYLAAEQAGGGGGFERVDKVTGGLGKRAWEHLTFLLLYYCIFIALMLFEFLDFVTQWSQ